MMIVYCMDGWTACLQQSIISKGEGRNAKYKERVSDVLLVHWLLEMFVLFA